MSNANNEQVNEGFYRKKPVVIKASRWFKNGDHPQDYSKEKTGFEGGELRTWTAEEVKANAWEGQIVRYFRRPDVLGSSPCRNCCGIMQDHGWIDTLEGGHIVCPGDWIITGVKGERYPVKPDIFESTYEPATRQTDKESLTTESHPTPEPAAGKADIYEYQTTDGQRKAWNGEPDLSKEGWEEYKPWERFEYHEERYWRRLKQPAQTDLETIAESICLWFYSDDEKEIAENDKQHVLEMLQKATQTLSNHLDASIKKAVDLRQERDALREGLARLTLEGDE